MSEEERHACLHRLLDASLTLPPEYRDQLSSHLPMALQALHALGASEARMHQFHAGYARRFEGLPRARPCAAAQDWRGLLGQVAAFESLRAGFEQALVREGTAAVLRQALPALLPGMAAAALHGLIRTAHALESGHRAELAAGLAYWACRWQPLAAPRSAVAPFPFEDWAARLVAQAPAWRSTAPLSSVRMAEAAETAPAYQALAAALQPTPDILARLAGLALARYGASLDFTLLHLVTGLRALRVLLPWIDDTAGLQPLLLRAFTAAYLAAAIKPMVVRPLPEPLAWPAVIAAALASDNDHVLKLVHACHEESRAYGETAYLAAAALTVSPAAP
jgi:hypothetical protein